VCGNLLEYILDGHSPAEIALGVAVVQNDPRRFIVPRLEVPVEGFTRKGTKVLEGNSMVLSLKRS
jgi:hypothetical protein